jgi:hypothetical protein
VPLNSTQLLCKYQQSIDCCLTPSSNTIDFLFAGAGSMPVGGTTSLAVDADLAVTTSCVADKTVLWSNSLNLPVKFDSANGQWTSLSGNTAFQDSQSFWMWGYDPGYSLFTSTNSSCSLCTPSSKTGLPTNWTNISFSYHSGQSSFLGVTTTGSLIHFGNRYYLFGCTSSDNYNIYCPYELNGRGSGWVKADQSIQRTGIGIKNDGKIYTWGDNYCGMRGDNTTTCCQAFTTLYCLPDCTWSTYAIKKGCHTLAITTTGELWSWGNNNSGQLGNETTIPRSSPGTVSGGGTNWCQVDIVNRSSGGIKTDGTLWVWGLNSSGQLGDGTTIGRSSPVSIAGGGDDWCKLSFGVYSTMGFALKLDGTLWSWGTDSSYCKLGTPGISARSSPVTLSIGGSDWCDVDSGQYSAYAIKTNGTLWAWGQDYYGTLGLGYPCNTTCYVSVPTQITGRCDWYKLHAGYNTGGATTLSEIV